MSFSDIADATFRDTIERAIVSPMRTLVEQLVTVARLGHNRVAMDETVDLVALPRDVVADRAPITIR